jgi:hypothetical protein
MIRYLPLVLAGCVLGLGTTPAAAQQRMRPLRHFAPAQPGTMMPNMLGTTFGLNRMGPLSAVGSLQFSTLPSFGGFSSGFGLGNPYVNPYLSAVRGYGGMRAAPGYSGGYGYGMGGNSYGAPAGGGYGMGMSPYPGVPAYGGAQGVNPYAPTGGAGSAPATQAAPQPEYATPATLLTAYGVPVENGHVQWPMAFRLMNSREVEEMQQPVESLLLLTAVAEMKGQKATAFVEDVEKAVAKLRRWLRERGDGMAVATLRDGNAFLRSLERALAKMKAEEIPAKKNGAAGSYRPAPY